MKGWLAAIGVASVLGLAACGQGGTAASNPERGMEMLPVASAPPVPGPASGPPAPRNPHLVDGVSQMTHFEPAAQDRADVDAPDGTHFPGAARIRRVPGGLINISFVSGRTYPDGAEAVWVANNNRIAKVRVDGGRFEEVARFPLPGVKVMSHADADAVTRALDAGVDDKALIARVRRDFPYYMERIASRGGIYPMMTARHEFYTIDRGRILVFTDDPRDIASPIRLVRTYTPPETFFDHDDVTRMVMGLVMSGDVSLDALGRGIGMKPDFLLGLNMTHDGHVIFASFGGAIGVIDQEFKGPLRALSFKGERIANSIAADDTGGIYVATESVMRKVVWTGDRLSADERDGAWTAAYDQAPHVLGGVRGRSRGTGSTPTLMGFGGDPDKLVVITDGEPVMKLVAFWRDDIPADARPVAGAKTPRIAGQIRVDFGWRGLAEAQSEQSVAVSGYGAFVVNNSMPAPAETALENLVTVGVTRPGPSGVQRIDWDPAQKAWRAVWARPDVSSPSTVPLITARDGQVFVNGAYNGVWEMTGLDWATGATRTRIVMGRSQAYNGAYSQVQALDNGDLVLGGLTGPLRISLDH